MSLARLGLPFGRLYNARLTKFLIVQQKQLFSGMYTTLPAAALNLGLSASSGTGTKILTLLAVLRRLNCPRTLTINSMRDPRYVSTLASAQMRGLTGVLRR